MEQEKVPLSIITPSAQQRHPTALELLTCFTMLLPVTLTHSIKRRVYVPRVSPPECPEAPNWVWEACQAETIIHV